MERTIMIPPQQEIDHIIAIVKEFDGIVKNAFKPKSDEETRTTTARVKEIGKEMKAFKEKYPTWKAQ